MAELVGLAFPFKINAKGGLSLARQSKTDTTIFDMKLEQLLNTNKGERTMECDVFSELDTFVFESTDLSTRTLLEYQIKDAILKHIPEITVISVQLYSEENSIIAIITYKINAYNTNGVAQVRIGDAA